MTKEEEQWRRCSTVYTQHTIQVAAKLAHSIVHSSPTQK